MIAAILLAAGSSRRFGDANKLLASVNGAPLVAYVVWALARSRLGSIVAVTGPDRDAVMTVIERALDNPRAGPAAPALTFVHNPRHADGIGTSVATGIGAVGVECTGVLIVQGDMPALAPVLIDALVARFEAMRGARVVLPTTPDSELMSPVLWPRRCFPELSRLDGDRGAKRLIASEDSTVETVLWADPRTFTDLDTHEALDHWQAGTAGM